MAPRSEETPKNNTVILRPAHVPKELIPLWQAAAKRIARKGRILNEDGLVDYLSINEEYRQLLSSQSKVAGDEGLKAFKGSKKVAAKPLNMAGVRALLPMVKKLQASAEELNADSRDDRLEVIIARVGALGKIVQNLLNQRT